MGRLPLRKALLLGGAVGGTVMLAAAPAFAQDDGTPPTGAPPPEFDETSAAEFEADLLVVLGETTGAPVDPTSFAVVVGLPGGLDAGPGALATTMATDAAAAAAAGDLGDGSELTGPCMGIALSFDGDGRLIDAAADFDPASPPVDMYGYYDSGGAEVRAAFTRKNPFTVDVDGFVAYTGVAGAAGDGPRDHTWEITTYGLELDSGGSANSDGDNRNAGSLDLGSDLPKAAQINALFRVEGSMTAANGFACSGSGYVETTGGAPLLEVTGGFLALVGGLGLVFNARPARTWRG